MSIEQASTAVGCSVNKHERKSEPPPSPVQSSPVLSCPVLSSRLRTSRLPIVLLLPLLLLLPLPLPLPPPPPCITAHAHSRRAQLPSMPNLCRSMYVPNCVFRPCHMPAHHPTGTHTRLGPSTPPVVSTADPPGLCCLLLGFPSVLVAASARIESSCFAPGDTPFCRQSAP